MKKFSGLITRLSKTLATLYVMPNDVARIVTKSKMNLSDISLSPRASDTWHSIIMQAIEKERILNLIKMALEDYPSHHVLLEANHVFSISFGSVTETPRIRKGANKKVLRLLLEYLDNSWIGFQAQKSNRNKLRLKMQNRLGLEKPEDIESFFPNHYSDMNQYEKRVHKVIRKYTEFIMANNTNALSLIEQHPQLEKLVPRIKTLKRHLRLWLHKYKAIFLEDESMCLLYTNMYDRMPFPKGVEKEIKLFLSAKK